MLPERRSVFDDDGGAEALLQPGRASGHRVDGAARGKRHDDLDHAGRPVLRASDPAGAAMAT